VNSVLNQTYSNLELIVVDDCSEVPTTHTLADIAAKDPRLHIVRHKQNMNVGAARNTGISQARGEFLALLDHDDLWHPEKLERQMAFLEKENCVACVTDLASFECKEYNRQNSKRDPTWLILTGSFLGMASSMLVRREVYDQVGNFNPDLPAMQDWDWLLRFYEMGLKLSVVPDSLTIYAGAHKRPAAVEIADIEFLKGKYMEKLDKKDQKVFAVALKWRIARAEFAGRNHVWGALGLVYLLMRHPINFGRYLSLVYEATFFQSASTSLG
jgi:glycosyltransferase involved in cell wall biosynthesis